MPTVAQTVPAPRLKVLSGVRDAGVVEHRRHQLRTACPQSQLIRPLVEVLVSGEHQVDLLADQQVGQVSTDLTPVHARADAELVHGHDDPGDTLRSRAVDCGRGPLVARSAGRVAHLTGPEVEVGADLDEPDDRRHLRVVHVVLAAIGADDAWDLIGQARGEVVDPAIQPTGLMVAAEQLEREPGADARRDEVAPGLFLAGRAIGQVADTDVHVVIDRTDGVHHRGRVGQHPVVAGRGEVHRRGTRLSCRTPARDHQDQDSDHPEDTTQVLHVRNVALMRVGSTGSLITIRLAGRELPAVITDP